MKFKNDEAARHWDTWWTAMHEPDLASGETSDVAELTITWAESMEGRPRTQEEFDRTLHRLNTPGVDIQKHFRGMYGILVQVWAYGDALKAAYSYG